MARRTNYFIPVFIILCLFSNKIFAQPTWTLDPFGNEKKPEKYEEKMLGSEKTATKKFGPVRHFIQNNVSHYNFYFNAKTKLNTVIERATLSQKDDYSQLLAFYPYSLENTASQKTELDTVIYKCTAGILLHDLRTDWVDNLYLLVGRSYFLQKKFDSAVIAFQFINYNLFPRKKHEDDGRLIGTNTSASYNVLSIANKEKRNFAQKVFTLPPSRNDALVWLTHTLIDQESYGDASGLINILQNDPNLPKRLRNDLEEVTAYWFYKQKTYDSAAVHLEKGITTAENKQDKARWEFLLGQLYEMSGSYDKASIYYKKSIKHTVDPLMDIYARLNDAKMLKSNGNEKELQKSIAKLRKMAKKDKFEAYRDIIYYSTGQLSMQKPDTTNSIVYYKKSVHYNETHPLFKNKAYLQLGNLAYNDRKYAMALAYYDSLTIPDTAMGKDFDGIEERRNSLRSVVKQVNIIQREDSLQLIAKMAPADRDALIKKLVKKYKKIAGQKEDDNFTGNTIITSIGKNNNPQDLFPDQQAKGEWYFYNGNLKSKGFGEFKAKWGKRNNVDNWRRKSATDAALTRNLNNDPDDPFLADSLRKADSIGNSKPQENSYDGMLANVPTTQEKMDSSNNRIVRAYVELAKLFQYDLEDYQQAINTYDTFLKRYPDSLRNGEIYLGYYYCYTKLGNLSKAAYYKSLLTKDFGNSKSATILNNPSAAQPDKNNPEASQRYEHIYNMFIEGDFANAVAEKRSADSLYGRNYWTPQLLYIEAINYIKERNDSLAIGSLTNIIGMYPNSPLRQKAVTMLDVLRRRAEIESYLTNLQVTRAEEDGKVIMSDDKPIEQVKNDNKIIEPKKIEGIKTNVRQDSIVTPPSMISGVYSWQGDQPQYIVMVLNKVDPVYINEAKNAFARYNSENHTSKHIIISKDQLDADRAMLIFTPFQNADDAIKYYDNIKKAAPGEVSWLQANKYSFLVISDKNLQLLKTNKDIDTYKVLLNNQYPGKF